MSLERRFGQSVIIWNDFSKNHSRATQYESILHGIHTNYSQTEDWQILDTPKSMDDVLAPYKAYDKLVKPSRS